jgi:hypothetical protein
LITSQNDFTAHDLVAVIPGKRQSDKTAWQGYGL